jgi:hypothetical protein
MLTKTGIAATGQISAKRIRSCSGNQFKRNSRSLSFDQTVFITPVTLACKASTLLYPLAMHF